MPSFLSTVGSCCCAHLLFGSRCCSGCSTVGSTLLLLLFFFKPRCNPCFFGIDSQSFGLPLCFDGSSCPIGPSTDRASHIVIIFHETGPNLFPPWFGFGDGHVLSRHVQRPLPLGGVAPNDKIGPIGRIRYQTTPCFINRIGIVVPTGPHQPFTTHQISFGQRIKFNIFPISILIVSIRIRFLLIILIVVVYGRRRRRGGCCCVHIRR